MKAIFIKEIGTRDFLRIYWGDSCKDGGCHNAMKFLKDSDKIADWNFAGEVKDYPESEWPIHCESCGDLIPKYTTKFKLNHQVFTKRLYNTPSGDPEAGNIYYNHWLPEDFYWDNHKGPHLECLVPNGEFWNIDSRASNCTMPNDRTHRCWVKHGNPEDGTIHVDKNGLTCNAGGGSIQTKNYHGFLHNGNFTP